MKKYENQLKVLELQNAVPDPEIYAHRSCPVLFQNEVFLFGAEHAAHYRRILMLKNNQLVKTGSLEFDFRIGRCANLGDELVFLCFSTVDDTERKTCRKVRNFRITKKPNNFQSTTPRFGRSFLGHFGGRPEQTKTGHGEGGLGSSDCKFS